MEKILFNLLEKYYAGCKMSGYLLCDKCRGYHKLKSDESPGDFTDKCSCGGNIRFSKSIDVIGAKNRERTFEKRQSITQKIKSSLFDWPIQKFTFSAFLNVLKGFKKDFQTRSDKIFEKIIMALGMPVCPYCKKRLKLKDITAGTLIKCSNCGRTSRKYKKH